MDKLKAAAVFTAYTLAIMAVVILPHLIAYSLVPEPPVRGGLSIPACATEDSVGCYWDASEQGNGLGEDVWN